MNRLADQYWRLNNLYYIIDKMGKKVKFKFNWAQQELYWQLWYFNLLLKARQLGMTTFICILFLDAALFNKTTSCGIIAHNREDTEKFFDKKIKFAYDNLPEEIKKARKPKTDSAKQYKFSNGSSISVGTSLRSDTLQFLHISEYGKICARYPEKAKEIRTGAINTIQAGNWCFMESTAEGNYGDFYTITQSAMNKARAGAELTPLDFKFFFFPWWKHPEYFLASTEKITVPPELKEYFYELEQVEKIKLSQDQKNWYIKKYELQQDEMMREYPSTPEEAFAVPLRGAYYEVQMRRMIIEGRLTKVPYDETIPVHTAWDLGIGDFMCFWFFQCVGKAIHLIDFYANTDKGFAWYKQILDRRRYFYGQHFAPFDINARQHSAGYEPENRLDLARQAGIEFTEIPKERDIMTGIQRTRSMFSTFWIDSEKCGQGEQSGVSALQLYRKEYNQVGQFFEERPYKDWTNHAADALRYISMVVKLDMVSNTIYNDKQAREDYINQRDLLSI